MSKVYSFRLCDDNPREAEAREVIKVWVGRGYSIRHVITEALIAYSKKEDNGDEFGALVDHLKELINDMENGVGIKMAKDKISLSMSFISAIKQSVRSGIKTE